MKKKTKSNVWHIQWMLLAFVALCFTSCKDDNEVQGGAFDPNRSVVISDFMPKGGGYGSNLILYGDNFGNDPSKVKVTIGGKDAKVIGLKNQSLYCVIPEKVSDKGDIQVSIIDDNGEAIAIAEAEGHFKYEKKWLVSTYIGTYYAVGTDYKEKEGPLNDCGAFKGILWFSFDPKSNFDKLYFTGDYDPCRLIDFSANNGEGYVYYFKAADEFDRVSVMTWTKDENQDMILSHNHANDTKYGNYLFTRESNFTQRKSIGAYARGVNGTIVHPETGDLYYSRYRAGDISRYNFETGETTFTFANPYTAVAVYMVIHPSGDYAYLIEADKHYIMRSDYNKNTNTFMTPYLVCGLAGSSGYADGVGSRARLNWPFQGVFVKNPDYASQKDEYDFYFCDRDNHAIRILTPKGRVSTFAGRGNNSTSGYKDGDLRTEALFRSPRAIAYDEKRQCFYIGDTGNWVIRKIAKEE